jgi:hypothetical protein
LANLLRLNRKVIIAQVTDGSCFSKHIALMHYGLKLNNYAAKCYWTKMPIYTVDGDGKCKSQL